MENVYWGQWIGELKGDNSGSLIMNIDQDTPNKGGIYFSDANRQLSSYIGKVIFMKKSDRLIAAVDNMLPINRPAVIDEFEAKAAVLTVSKLTDNIMEGTWSAENNQEGEFRLCRREGTKPAVKSESVNWTDFIKISLEAKRLNKSLIFRGQSDSTWPLRTSFHRSNRRDLSRYSAEDMVQLNKYLTLSGNRKFNLSDANEFAELMSLAQHHGYPTPLLDWSQSPLVAAFFAFRSVARDNTEGSVRIYFFDYKKWESEGQKYRSLSIDDPRYSLTTLDINSQGNLRVLPQQSLFTFTNITDVERWITAFEKDGKEFIKAYDIPKSSAQDALNDLDNMNINAASLFPGLDGSFEALRSRLFKI